MVKCSEVQSSVAAEAFGLTIAAATAATTIAVAAVHKKTHTNEYQTVGKVNTLNILLKLSSEDFFLLQAKL